MSRHERAVERAEHLAAQRRRVGDRPDANEHAHAGDCEEARRHEAPQASGVEGPTVDAPGHDPFAQQQRGDEEPGQREEHRDAEVATGHPRRAEVEEQHRRDGHGPEAVERGLVPELDRLLRPLRRADHRVSPSNGPPFCPCRGTVPVAPTHESLVRSAHLRGRSVQPSTGRLVNAVPGLWDCEVLAG